jgi:hypothetical protein
LCIAASVAGSWAGARFERARLLYGFWEREIVSCMSTTGVSAGTPRAATQWSLEGEGTLLPDGRSIFGIRIPGPDSVCCGLAVCRHW